VVDERSVGIGDGVQGGVGRSVAVGVDARLLHAAVPQVAVVVVGQTGLAGKHEGSEYEGYDDDRGEGESGLAPEGQQVAPGRDPVEGQVCVGVVAQPADPGQSREGQGEEQEPKEST
jgi:hypothetical protein